MDREINKQPSDPNSASSDGSRRSDDGTSWWGNWGQGWIDTVKEKSASTLEMVKKDLNEFVEVIQGDTSVVISETATKLEEKLEDNSEKTVKQDDDSMNTTEMMKHGVKGISKVLHTLSDMMSIQEPDDTNEEFITLTDDEFSLTSYNRKQEKLHNIQIDPGTYCNDPEGPFSDWLQVFLLDDNKEDMSNLLTQNPKIRAIYSQLVPSVVSHTTFWQRYYYQVFLLESEERKREALLKRASNSIDKPKDEDEDDGWGDDEDDIEIVLEDTSSKDVSIRNNETDSPQYYTNSIVATDLIRKETKEITDKNVLKKSPQEKISEPNQQTIRNDSNKNEKVKDIMETPTLKIYQTTPDNTNKTAQIETLIETTEDSKVLDVNSATNELQCVDITENESFNNKTLQAVSTDALSNSSTESPSHGLESKPELSETGSVSSWLSIDDDIKVKKIKEDQIAKEVVGSPRSDGGSSSNSSGVLINKSETDDLDDDDFDIDLDDVDDVNEEELSKMVADIKNKSAIGAIQDDDDDDWENWE